MATSLALLRSSSRGQLLLLCGRPSTSSDEVQSFTSTLLLGARQQASLKLYDESSFIFRRRTHLCLPELQNSMSPFLMLSSLNSHSYPCFLSSLGLAYLKWCTHQDPPTFFICSSTRKKTKHDTSKGGNDRENVLNISPVRRTV
ncbi:unnamed protein product [Linum tenue]|uniref:Uncharacterized protein n=1 Tax=Linum tenue TaxID=586396 RepID=A0AAV0HRV4_9ROSI|nr:unnamed protein product [Linum tenue]